MKLSNIVILCVIILLLFSGCDQQLGIIELQTEDGATAANESVLGDDPIRDRMITRCEEIAAMYYDLYMESEKSEPEDQWSEPMLPQSSIDAIERLLFEAGIDVLDTNGNYPSYLPTANRLYAFLDCVQRGELAEHEIFTILESGDLAYRLFRYEEEGMYFYTMRFNLDRDEEPYYERHRILDWELTDKGNFFYRIYPAGDKHYEDYALIRTVQPDTELFDLTYQYIYPGGYIGSNIFLIDWDEGNWNELSFNDVWEYLYFTCYGEQYQSDSVTYIPEKDGYMVSASAFEDVVMSYFNIDIDTFREMAQYDAEEDCYPWRPLYTNDFVFLWYYACEPEVAAYKVNSDGTITLTVEMLSTDLKMDRLFAHEVTVRPLENGQFQYVGNRVTYQTEYGLPYCEPRLTWGVSD